jgi:predicted patatin/cPLA2 family phospholipase
VAESWWEWSRGRRFWKLMNLDYLIDDVVKGQKPINQEKIFNPKTLFKIYLAEPKSGVTLAVTNLEKDIIFQALKATCAFPGCYYPLVRINGKKYLDGNSVKVFPLEQAKNDGCTDLLIVTTVDKDHTEPVSKSLRNRILFTTFMFPLGRKFKERFNKRTLEYNKELDYVFGRKGIEGINIYTISPEYMLSNSCTNYEKLKEFAKHGRERAKESFQRVEDRVLR